MTKHTVLREGTARHDPCGEREAFEAMMRSQTFDSLKRLSDGSYESYEARVGWLAWNVRASQGQAPAMPECLTCNDHGAVGNILTAEPCPDCTRKAAPAAVAGPSLYQVMAVAKAIHATTPDADDWDSLRQCEVDALRGRAEKVLAALATAANHPASATAGGITAG